MTPRQKYIRLFHSHPQGPASSKQASAAKWFPILRPFAMRRTCQVADLVHAKGRELVKFREGWRWGIVKGDELTARFETIDQAERYAKVIREEE